MLYVDGRGNLCVLYEDTTTSWTVHHIDESGEDAFGSLSAVSPVHVFFRPQADVLVKGVRVGPRIAWDDGTEWSPVAVSRLQYKYLTQMPYIPMTIVLLYGCMYACNAVADHCKSYVKRIRMAAVGA